MYIIFYIKKVGQYPSITQPENVNFPHIASDERFVLDIETRSQKRARTENEEAGDTDRINRSIVSRELAINNEIIANVRRHSSQRTIQLETTNNDANGLVSDNVKTFWWSTNAWKIFLGLLIYSKDLVPMIAW